MFVSCLIVVTCSDFSLTGICDISGIGHCLSVCPCCLGASKPFAFLMRCSVWLQFESLSDSKQWKLPYTKWVKLPYCLMWKKQCISKKLIRAECVFELSKFKYNKMHTFLRRDMNEKIRIQVFFTLLFLPVHDNSGFKFLITGEDKPVSDRVFCCKKLFCLSFLLLYMREWVCSHCFYCLPWWKSWMRCRCAVIVWMCFSIPEAHGSGVLQCWCKW